MALVKETRRMKTESPQRARAPERGKYYSRAVGKALEILELMQMREYPMTLNEIARQIRLSKTSTFRLLYTLQVSGWLGTDANGSYRLVPEVRSTVPTQFLVRLLRVATPKLKDLSANLRETVSLAALFENRVEVVAVFESPEVIRMSNVVGHIVPPNASSLGKAIVAFQTPERREKLLRSMGVYRFTNHTITDPTELAHEFERIRMQKFAVDREESVKDGCCFGVPIIGESEEVLAAISVSIPKVRLRDEKQE